MNRKHYEVEEFDLSGGRTIFQGTNGSGKSRTLELLLPLCLDGDLQIGYIYEGLLGYTTTEVSEVTVGLRGTPGEEPEMALAQLEALADANRGDTAFAMASRSGQRGRIRLLSLAFPLLLGPCR